MWLYRKRLPETQGPLSVRYSVQWCWTGLGPYEATCSFLTVHASRFWLSSLSTNKGLDSLDSFRLSAKIPVNVIGKGAEMASACIRAESNTVAPRQRRCAALRRPREFCSNAYEVRSLGTKGAFFLTPNLSRTSVGSKESCFFFNLAH